MALDKDIRLYLESLEGLPAPSRHPEDIPVTRQAMHEFWLSRPAPEPLAEVQDMQAPGRDGPDVALRLYRPPQLGHDLPLVLFTHGGGFVFGSLDTHDAICHRLSLEAGVAVLSVGYRLAPEDPFPAAVNDTLDALEWAVLNHDRLGADPQKLFVAGDSAGANLAAVAAQVAVDTGVQLAGQALIYPVTDLREGDYESRRTRADGFGLNEEDMRWYRQLYLGASLQAGSPLASPIARQKLAGLSPAFIMTAGFDPLCSEGRVYASRLREAGVEVEHLHLEGANHGVFSNWELFGAGETTWQALLGWLKARLRQS